MKHAEPAPTRASPAAHAADALKRAQQLVDSRMADGQDAGWVHLAHHVGDLSVLAVTLSR
ncbi:MAG TPA: hypothetical protein VGF81_16060 [Solirubrobacteraceae bacterium]|jgi:hypothetical protein